MLKIYEFEVPFDLEVAIVPLDSEERQEHIVGSSTRWAIECRKCGYQDPESSIHPKGYFSLDAAIDRLKKLPDLNCNCDKE